MATYRLNHSSRRFSEKVLNKVKIMRHNKSKVSLLKIIPHIWETTKPLDNKSPKSDKTFYLLFHRRRRTNKRSQEVRAEEEEDHHDNHQTRIAQRIQAVAQKEWKFKTKKTLNNFKTLRTCHPYTELFFFLRSLIISLQSTQLKPLF